MTVAQKIFIDDSGWFAIIDQKAPNHNLFVEQFQSALKGETGFFTSNISIGNAISRIRKELSIELSIKYNEIVEEAHMGNHLRILWIGRRTQKEAVRFMRKYPNLSLHLYDFAHAVLMEKRRINTIISDRAEFKKLGYAILPETNNE